MQREIHELSQKTFDLIVIGGGAFGACAALDGALRGLRVALVERWDFGGGASGECFKMVHGGIRYLQHADIKRLRWSSQERRALLRIAPHLVEPLPIVMPTYGRGRNSKWFLGTGMKLYDLLTWDRSRGIHDYSRQIRATWSLPRSEVLRLYPDLPRENLTGARVFEDGQMYSPPRLVFALAETAARAGACCVNYAEAVGLHVEGSAVRGVRIRDNVTGDEFVAQTRCVINAAGPWADYLLCSVPSLKSWRRGNYSRDACFVISRRFSGPYALALPGRTHDSGALVSRAARHMFLVPWREYTLVGVWHRIHRERPDEACVSEEELAEWIEEINGCYPALRLTLDDVLFANWGLVPFGDIDPQSGDMRFGKESILVDHSRRDGLAGLITLIGIRYTTARGDAARALELAAAMLDRPGPEPATDVTPLVGGDIEDFSSFEGDALRKRPVWLNERSLKALLRNHGTEYSRVLDLVRDDPELGRTLGDTEVIGAEVVHAVRHESAIRLVDVLLRRTGMATGSHPGAPALARCADLMGSLLGWTSTQRSAELEFAEAVLKRHHAKHKGHAESRDSQHGDTGAAA